MTVTVTTITSGIDGWTFPEDHAPVRITRYECRMSIIEWVFWQYDALLRRLAD